MICLMLLLKIALDSRKFDLVEHNGSDASGRVPALPDVGHSLAGASSGEVSSFHCVPQREIRPLFFFYLCTVLDLFGGFLLLCFRLKNNVCRQCNGY
ncbi:hypothetical protein AVEN_208206-1 [Araneus ventricosus]|uniref:Uncharacterized protein n=1 Tax=Araneus ventricosus TaxID=182803 RepID=A0A4Y2LIW1_ARAVE|nr:hypothetical protein AVEN_208206-1 [Araneus ventricosus]